MKKKFLLFALFIIFLFPLNAKAYTYSTVAIKREVLTNIYHLNWPTSPYYVNSGDRGEQDDTNQFWVHAIDGQVSICGGIGKETLASATMTQHDKINEFKNNLGQTLSENQQKLLMDLLVFGYHHPGAIGTVDDSAESLFSMISMQIIAWEIIEGGRTKFYNSGATDTDPYAPTGYNLGNSAYNKVIFANGGSSPNTSGTLYYYYKKILNDCYNATVQSPASFNGKPYVLEWNQSNNRYETKVNIGSYKHCTSYNTNFKVSVTGSIATVYTGKSLPAANAKITCDYVKGNGSQNEHDEFYYYEFPNSGVCVNDGCQKVIYGKAVKKYSAYFTVSTESTNLKIVKKNKNNEKISGAKFKIYRCNNGINNCTNPSSPITIDGNGDAQIINKSGDYKVLESVTPAGMQDLSEFYLKINLTDNLVTDCTGKKEVSSLIQSCLNGAVKVSYLDNTIILTIVNESKNFTFKKVDENGTEIKGATFRIKDSSNKDVKFSLDSGNTIKYDPNGKIVDISDPNYSQFKVSLLPAGEYSLVETAVPSPYVLPSKEEDRIVKFKVDTNYQLYEYDSGTKKYSKKTVLTVKNYKSVVSIIKNGTVPLEGVKFRLYKEDKTTFVKSNLKSSGIYEYNSYTTDQTEATEYVTNSDGIIELNNLPLGVYYLFEFASVSPYSPPEGDAAYTKLEIDITKDGLQLNKKKYNGTPFGISNAPNVFSFYKVDENGKNLSGGKYKIQKYDTEKDMYRDIKVKKVANDGSYSENADVFEPSDDGTILFTLTHGIATFTKMPASTKYRIVEREAPSGFVKVTLSDSPTVTIDEYGYSSGLLTLINQKVSVRTGDAEAELIISISTGQQVIKYGLIIGGVVIATIVLIIFAKKVDSNKDKKVNKEEK